MKTKFFVVFLLVGPMSRMQILTTAEHDAFDTPPVFGYAERETFFHVWVEPYKGTQSFIRIVEIL